MSKIKATTTPPTSLSPKVPSEAYLQLLKKEVPTLDVKKLAGKA